MAKYVYPAIFTTEEEGGYSVNFPDIEGCFTQGENMVEAVEMAKDALCLMLYNFEEKGAGFLNKISKPSDINALKLNNNQIASLISCDTNYYKRYFEAKSVKLSSNININTIRNTI